MFPSVCPLLETWRNIGRKQCFRNNVSQFVQGLRRKGQFLVKERNRNYYLEKTLRNTGENEPQLYLHEFSNTSSTDQSTILNNSLCSTFGNKLNSGSPITVWKYLQVVHFVITMLTFCVKNWWPMVYPIQLLKRYQFVVNVI